MLKKMKTNEGIQYKKLSPEEMKERGILGRLIGPCADFNNATRNGRKYSEQLWENVFNDPIMQEKIKNGVCFGELGHPEDRTEIDMEKIAVCLREQPVKNEKGQLCAVFDILDTPNGRILKTLCDYGSTVGVSSRGQGDIITDIHGEEAVDPDTYECECWDVVLVPAVESARMTYVKEDLENKKYLKMKKALTESLNNATEEDKKVMKETLSELNIKLDEDTANMDKEDIAKYAAQADSFVKDIAKMSADAAHDWFFKEFEFDKKPPEDEQEQKIYDALKAKLGESLNEEAEDEEQAEEEISTDETPQEENIADLPINAEEASAEGEQEEIPDVLEFDGEAEIIPEENPEEAPIEEPTEEDTRTDEEIFFDYLKANFDEKQIKKACKALDIEVPEEDEEEDKEDEEAPAEEEVPEEAEESEESPTEVQDEEEEPKEIDEDFDDEDDEQEAKEEAALSKLSNDLNKSVEFEGQGDFGDLVGVIVDGKYIGEFPETKINGKSEDEIYNFTKEFIQSKIDEDKEKEPVDESLFS